MGWVIGLVVLLGLSQLVRMASRRRPRAGFVTGSIFACVVFGACWWMAVAQEADVETGSWLTALRPLPFWFCAGVTLLWSCVQGIKGLLKIRAAQKEEKAIDAWVAGTFLYFLPVVAGAIFYFD